MNTSIRHAGLTMLAFAILGLAACASTKEENADAPMDTAADSAMAPAETAPPPPPASEEVPPPADATTAPPPAEGTPTDGTP